jgi:peptide/nickel transport system substrate-binding protein
MPQPPAAVPGRRQFLAGLAGTAMTASAGGLLAACGSPARAAPSHPAARPRRGGTLKVGLTGGSPADSIDPGKGVTYLDFSRDNALYDPLVLLNAAAQLEYKLAEEITPTNRALSEWVIRLRPGITFHSGKPLTAADVIWTFRRILAGTLAGHVALGPADPRGLKALDPRTVLVPMTRPFGSFTDQLAAFFVLLYIIPDGFDPRPARAGRDRAVRLPEFHPRPAQRVHPQPALLENRPAPR